MPQNLTDWLGLAGFGLALLLALFELWKYRQENEERVQVRLRSSYGASGVSSPLIATVVNVGKTIVHLDKVVLQHGPNQPQIDRPIIAIPLDVIRQDVGDTPCNSQVIEPGEKREYCVLGGHPMLSQFAAASSSEVRLVVYSNRGAIAQVSGDLVAPYLRPSAPAS